MTASGSETVDDLAFRALETHLSWVFFVGDQVFKVKKPAIFDFVDWRTGRARADACRTEVRLNRRLSPDVYRGVGRFRHPDGRTEPVVVMRRLASQRSLSALLRRADPALDDYVADVGRILAEFHRRARRGADVNANSRPARLRDMWERNLAEIKALASSPIPVAQLDTALALAVRYLVGRDALIAERIRDGRAVDGHGDVLCDDIFCLDDGPRILDCLEFDARLRLADTVADVAFLGMDLEHRGRPDLTAVLFGAYQRESGDEWPDTWSDFWMAYRATVRAKVCCIRGSGGEKEAIAEAAELMALAITHLRRAQVRMVLVGGLPGTGKSTLAQAIAGRTGWKVISSDVIRRGGYESAGAPSTGGYGEGRYSTLGVEANYREMLSLGREQLTRGQSVILDATWATEDRRRSAQRMAEELACEVIGLECDAPGEVADARIRNRRADDYSEATPEVARRMAKTWDAWPDAVRLDMTDTTENTLNQIAYLWRDQPGPLSASPCP